MLEQRQVQQAIAALLCNLEWSSQYDVVKLDASELGKVIVTTPTRTVKVTIEIEEAAS